nr:hypothetical protein Iba_chr03bCG0250 [Ipomoea batatas]
MQESIHPGDTTLSSKGMASSDPMQARSPTAVTISSYMESTSQSNGLATVGGSTCTSMHGTEVSAAARHGIGRDD